MINISYLVSAAAAGFIISVMVMDLTRVLIGAQWPTQRVGLQLETRALPFLLALIAGPALLWKASRDARVIRKQVPLTEVAGFLLTVIWSGCYGLVVFGVAGRIASVLTAS